MTQVLHTGDTHLGYRQYHSPERQQDFLSAFERVIEDAIDADVDAVVHAGDLFHDRRPRLQDILGALGTLRELDAAAIPFLAIVGNHEGKRDAQWLDLFESLDLAIRLDEEPTVIGNTAFYGLDFVARAARDDLEYEFAPHDAPHAALVSHGLFQPFSHGDWDAEEILAESTVDFDAMLLGDDHTPARREVDGTWLTYCGSTERASASEREARGYNLVTFDDGVDIRRRSVETREFVFVDLELAEGEGTERVHNRVGQHDLADAVVIVTIEGEGERVPPATIEEFAREKGALVARVNDRREIEEEAAYEVNFADPDDAVRERIDQLGLSPAASELDEVVRASKVADSNVDDAVESRARELIEEGDAEQFEPAPVENDDRAETESEPASEGEQPDDESRSDGGGGQTDYDEGRSDDGGEQTDGGGQTDNDESRSDDGGEQTDGGGEQTDGGGGQTDDDGQATMGEYL
ncbi:DNA double-strand break repair protein Mre11 [Halorhabdus tiamatea SARL4B]|uniref:DNA double-strand break repair protein Mre11 n=1 Tax=Halorhabdus tiamatea SARL4B TaxID=1033806 RepID=F7PMU6_9EURY|nr:DNA double-strand break repair protein Mre11 [Halorhabdus tiamatea]ERJ07654.1 DNA double-strand break repair protein Mre11 [Halorhabdus tiamatea SARL4B]CCQ32690.1 DNA double-strand break repair protein Mre11 [Halorhabdus tiamatea SARL4B]